MSDAFMSKPNIASPAQRPAWSMDDAALLELRRRMIRLAVKLVWNRDDAEEIVQEALRLAISKEIRTEEAHFRPWLYRTVSHLCLNQRRRHRAEPLANWMDPAHGSSPEAAMMTQERLSRVREAIAELPAQQRLALVLKTMEELSYAEIAEVMQLSPSAVRAHVHWARRRLAEQL